MKERYQNTLELEVNLGETTGDLDFWQTICRRRAGSAGCPRCGKPVDLMSFGDAARCFNTDEQDIEFLGSTGRVHLLHNRFGEVMVCCNSLFVCFDTRPTRLLDSHFEKEIQNSGRF